MDKQAINVELFYLRWIIRHLNRTSYYCQQNIKLCLFLFYFNLSFCLYAEMEVHEQAKWILYSINVASGSI